MVSYGSIDFESMSETLRTHSAEVDPPEYKRAEVILHNLNLTWETLEHKSVLDLGAGDSSLSIAAKKFCPTATIVSLDTYPRIKTEEHSPLNHPTVQADAADMLPFANQSFDFVIGHGSVSSEVIPQLIRTLKPGGEIRVTPFFSRDFFFMQYYLMKYEGFSEEDAQHQLAEIAHEMNEDENYTSANYRVLLEKTLNTLSPEEKREVLGQMGNSISKRLSVPLSVEIIDERSRDPWGILVYKQE